MLKQLKACPTRCQKVQPSRNFQDCDFKFQSRFAEVPQRGTAARCLDIDTDIDVAADKNSSLFLQTGCTVTCSYPEHPAGLTHYKYWAPAACPVRQSPSSYLKGMANLVSPTHKWARAVNLMLLLRPHLLSGTLAMRPKPCASRSGSFGAAKVLQARLTWEMRGHEAAT